MATAEKRPRAFYFSPMELEILMSAYAEYKGTFKKKGNTVAAVKEREQAWQEIADRVNVCNPTGTKRSWQQLKMKYKNIVQTANRKKAEAQTGGGPPPPPTEAEEMVSRNSGHPVAEGISGGSASDPVMPQDTKAYIRVTDGVICLLEPSAITDTHAVDDDDDDDDDDLDTMTAATEREDAERPIESNTANFNKDASTSTTQLTSLPVKQMCKVYFEKQIQKSDSEMEHMKLQMKKTQLEIQLLEHQLKEIKKTS